MTNIISSVTAKRIVKECIASQLERKKLNVKNI